MAGKGRVIAQQVKQLPIYSAKDAFMEEFEKNDCLVIVGETGSGKGSFRPLFGVVPDLLLLVPLLRGSDLLGKTTRK